MSLTSNKRRKTKNLRYGQTYWKLSSECRRDVLRGYFLKILAKNTNCQCWRLYGYGDTGDAAKPIKFILMNRNRFAGSVGPEEKNILITMSIQVAT